MTDIPTRDDPSAAGGPTVATLFDPAHRADPYPAYRRWREQAPVAPIGPGFLVLTGHGACSEVLAVLSRREQEIMLAPRIEEVTAGLVGDAIAAGDTDLLACLAAPLPVIVISELLGVPSADHARFVQWAHAMARGLDPHFLLAPQVREQQARAALGMGLLAW